MLIHYIALVLLHIVHVLSLSDVALILRQLILYVFSAASLSLHYYRLVGLRDYVCACVAQ